MKEESTFFGSKMLEIDDIVEVNNQGIIFYQNSKNEQIDLDIEKSLSPVVYSASDDKKINHTLVIDDSQSEIQRNNLTKYIITINLKSILENYIFATLKQYRTFEGVKNTMCYTKDVNFSIKEYVIKNILDRYKFDKVELYIRYIDLREQNVRRFVNTWYTSNDIISSEYLNNKIQTDTEFNQSSVQVLFNQEKSSQQYSFEYYFKLFWVKL
ncbi:MAG TPA: hypothetical protein PLT15_04415 [Bacilli bacterium]|nr:hypothetical protein [Bacilli bacterium]